MFVAVPARCLGNRLVVSERVCLHGESGLEKVYRTHEVRRNWTWDSIVLHM